MCFISLCDNDVDVWSVEFGREELIILSICVFNSRGQHCRLWFVGGWLVAVLVMTGTGLW